jgi:hypothetical protein
VLPVNVVPGKNEADNMVKQIRDQNDLIEVLRAQLEKKD